MSDTKWTPGPWDKLVKMEGFTAVGAKTLIARVFSPAFRDHDTETANARLIATAPELYEALAALCQYYGFVQVPIPVSSDAKVWYAAFTALAKARGEA